MMTSYPTAEVLAPALARGARHVLSKPFEMSLIEEIVRRAHDDQTRRPPGASQPGGRDA
jgi:hypothetical protein